MWNCQGSLWCYCNKHIWVVSALSVYKVTLQVIDDNNLIDRADFYQLYCSSIFCRLNRAEDDAGLSSYITWCTCGARKFGSLTGIKSYCQKCWRLPVAAYLKWSWRATLKSNASPRSPNPTPMKALRPANKHACYVSRQENDTNTIRTYSHPHRCHPVSAGQSIGWNRWLFPPRCQGTPSPVPVQTAPLQGRRTNHSYKHDCHSSSLFRMVTGNSGVSCGPNARLVFYPRLCPPVW